MVIGRCFRYKQIVWKYRKTFTFFKKKFHKMWYLLYNMGMKHQPILEALKQQIEMEKNLSYGDSFNFIGGIVGRNKDINIVEEKNLTEVKI